MPVPINLIEVLDKGKVSKISLPSVEKEMALYPTEASVAYTSPSGRKVLEGACHRAVYYRITKEPVTNPPESRMEWVWWAGQSWEDEGKRCMEREGALVSSHTRFLYRDPAIQIPISGEIDAIGWDPVNSCYYIAEFKSTGGSYIGRKKLMGSKKEAPVPKTENLLQLLVYMDRVKEAKYGILAYLIRDKMERTQFAVVLQGEGLDRYPLVGAPGQNPVPLPHITYRSIYQRYQEAAQQILSNKLPPRDYALKYSDTEAMGLLADGEISKKQLDEHLRGENTLGSWHCGYCQYCTKCWSS